MTHPASCLPPTILPGRRGQAGQEVRPVSRWIGVYGEGARRRFQALAFALEPLVRRVVPVRQPVFVVGCPPSGTTVFTDALARHPDLANLSEGAWIWDAAYRSREGDHARAACDLTPSERRRISGIVRLYMAPRPGRTCLNKHPRNSLRIGFLEALFPGARFIHVVRDGRAVVASLLAAGERKESRQGSPFGNFCKPPGWRDHLHRPPVEQAAHQWNEIVRLTRAALADLAPARHIELRYEAFCAPPAAALAHCDCALCLPSFDRDLSHLALNNRNHKWRSQLSPADLLAVHRICGPLLLDLGYPVEAGG